MDISILEEVFGLSEAEYDERNAIMAELYT